MSIEGIEIKRFTPDLPTINVIQPLSPELSNEVEGFKMGGLYLATRDDDSQDKKRLLINKGTEVIIHRMWVGRILWAPRGTPGRMIDCISHDEKRGTSGRKCNKTCGNFEFGSGCNRQYIVVVSTVASPGKLMRIPLSKSSFKVGTKLVNEIEKLCGKKGEKAPLGSLKWKLDTVKETNKANNSVYFVINITAAGTAPATIADAVSDAAAAAQEHREEMLASFYENLVDEEPAAAAMDTSIQDSGLTGLAALTAAGIGAGQPTVATTAAPL